MDSDKSLYLGLIINELITNSVKHAKIGEDDQLHINLQLLKKGETINLHYVDNGQEPNSSSTTESQGLTLIQNLCEQLGGKMNQVYQNGYQFKLVI